MKQNTEVCMIMFSIKICECIIYSFALSPFFVEENNFAIEIMQMRTDTVPGFRPLVQLATVYICQVCHKALPSEADVWQHMRSCFDPTVEMRVQLQHLTEEQLLAHKVPSKQIGTVLENMLRLKCPICKWQSNDLQSRKLHMREHKFPSPNRNSTLKSLAPIKKLVCDFPQCTFSSKLIEGMNWHQNRVHESQSPIVLLCDYCDFVFMRTKHFNIHVNSHKSEGSGVLKCLFKSCKFLRFHSVPHLKSHSQTHRVNQFFCIRCGKFYMTILALNRHKLKHLGQL